MEPPQPPRFAFRRIFDCDRQQSAPCPLRQARQACRQLWDAATFLEGHYTLGTANLQHKQCREGRTVRASCVLLLHRLLLRKTRLNLLLKMPLTACRHRLQRRTSSGIVHCKLLQRMCMLVKVDTRRPIDVARSASRPSTNQHLHRHILNQRWHGRPENRSSGTKIKSQCFTCPISKPGLPES